MRVKRVLIVGPFGHGQLPLSLANALEDLGAETIRFDSDRSYMSACPGASHRVIRRMLRPLLWRHVNRETVAIVKQHRPDLVLMVKAAFLEPETVRHIRTAMGVPIVNYYPDHPYCGVPLDPLQTSAQRRNLIDVLREYTHVWVWERSLVARLRGDRVAAGYLPFGVDWDCAASARRVVPTRPDRDVVFVGRHTTKRQTHVAAVRRYRVSVWGNRWRRAHRTFSGRHVIHSTPVFGRQAAEIYAAAATSLNVLDDLNMPGHNMRTFEIPASGGLMLATFTSEQAEFFPEGEAAMYYRDPNELEEHIDRALRDRAWSARIRTKALAIAAEHTYAARMKTMLGALHR